jgi:5-formyltetrahydrofolate cyclo-ligase
MSASFFVHEHQELSEQRMFPLLMTSKVELRMKLLAERRALDRQSWLRASDTIAERLISMPPFRVASRIHCYVSIEKNREVSTLALLERLAGEGRSVMIPCMEGERMLTARYQPGQRFSYPKSGAPLPDPVVVSDDDRFDMVIVPLVGFDRKGGRIGYGKGWYDRFFQALTFKGIRPARIGLAFGFQELPLIPQDAWDQSLDFVVTENEIVNCMNSCS